MLYLHNNIIVLMSPTTKQEKPTFYNKFCQHRLFYLKHYCTFCLKSVVPTERRALVYFINAVSCVLHTATVKYNNVSILFVQHCTTRPDTSRRQRRRLPPSPLAIALVPLKGSSRNLQFPHRVPFAKEKMPWCPCLFKNEAYRPVPCCTWSQHETMDESHLYCTAHGNLDPNLLINSRLPHWEMIIYTLSIAHVHLYSTCFAEMTLFKAHHSHIYLTYSVHFVHNGACNVLHCQ